MTVTLGTDTRTGTGYWAPDFYVNNILCINDRKSNEDTDAFNHVIGLDKTGLLVEVSADMLYAHAIGKDTCNGDSGGPLVIVPNKSSHPSDHILETIFQQGLLSAIICHQYRNDTILHKSTRNCLVTTFTGTTVVMQKQKTQKKKKKHLKEDQHHRRIMLFAQPMKAQDRIVQ
eukprot:scaffold48881_cov62-Attheya_sp.AAC.10